jgi:Transposase DDE domain
MTTRSEERCGRFPQSVAADTTSGNSELLAWFEERDITPYIRVKESPAPKTNLYGIEKFTYVAETNSYQCPEGKRLTYVGINAINRTHVYVATWKRCRDCPQKTQCTKGRYRQIAIHVHEPAQRASERATVPAFAAEQRQRRKIEALFAELKNQIGLRRVRLRRMKHVREQFFLAATAQNLKRLARFLRSRSLESVTVPI